MDELLERDSKLFKEYQIYSAKLALIKREIEKNRAAIQDICVHEWTVELQPYQKETYCKKCRLVDWERTRYY